MSNFSNKFKREFLKNLGFTIFKVKFISFRWDDREKIWQTRNKSSHYLAYLSDTLPEELKEYEKGIIEDKTDYEITVGGLKKYNLEEVFSTQYEHFILSQVKLLYKNKQNI